MLAEAERKAEEHRAKERKKVEESKADKRSMLFWILLIAAFALIYYAFLTKK
jgi:capsule polysaccharide export protein KpsE/RkpR